MLKFYLVIERGLVGERVYHLQTRLTMGRAPESDIHLPDPSVSGLHALAYLEDEKVVIEDAGSRNGTYVNEERVGKAILSHNDIVRIGNATVEFVVKGLPEEKHRERLSHKERIRGSSGFERRKHQRYEIPLTVSFSISPDLSLSCQFQRRIFQGISTDISLSGVRVKFKEKSLRLLPMGCNARLEIVLPPPWVSIRCIGIVRHMMEADEGDDKTHVGIEFSDIGSVTQKMLENFLYSCVTAEA